MLAPPFLGSSPPIAVKFSVTNHLSMSYLWGGMPYIPYYCT